MRKPYVQVLIIALSLFFENYKSINDFRFSYGVSFLSLILIGFVHEL
jgi:hypothetical protein